jgi:NAD(P)H-dependent FMN reductase
MKLSLIYGTAAPAGRLAAAMTSFKTAMEANGKASAVTLSLAATPLDWADGRPDEKLPTASRTMIEEISSSAGMVVFTPVYRAAAPGALKNMFDLLPVEALEAKPVGIVAMGATLHHFLGVDAGLHPVLAWFGAVVIPPGVYLTSASFEAGVVTKTAEEELAAYARTMVDFAGRLSGARIEPRPLAARARA